MGRDLLVPVPKGEEAHFWAPQKTEGTRPNWVLKAKRKDFAPGDTLWFHLNGQIVARVRVLGIDVDPFVCQDTGRYWEGCSLYWEWGDMERLDPPLPGKKLLRSSMYLDTFLKTHPELVERIQRLRGPE